jgi:hypothetical protein
VIACDRRSIIDCVVHNLSQTGTCLQVASVVGIPPTLDSQIDHEPASRPCAAIWPNRIGIEFRRGPTPQSAPIPAHYPAARTDYVRSPNATFL